MQKILERLSSVELFRNIPRDALEALAKDLESVFLKNGEVLIRQGDPGDCAYVVLSGRLLVVLETDEGQKKVVAEIGRGESVGEMALVTGEVRTTDVIAARDSELLKISKQLFDSMMLAFPAALLQVTRTLVARLKKTTRLVERKAPRRTFAVIAAGQGGAAAAALAKRLTHSLMQRGRVKHLSAAIYQERFQIKSAAKKRDEDARLTSDIVAWLSDVEEQHDFVVYEAEQSLSSWTQRCIRSADVILLVGSDQAKHELNEVETFLFTPEHVSVPIELILLRANSRPRFDGTRYWLSVRQVTSIHHARLDRDDDLQRITRTLLGHGVGLVLGGGGARGLAHIGVIKAMLEAKVPIDMIGGTSAGALVGGLYALGLSPKEQQEIIKKYARLFNPTRKVTLPLISLINTASLEKIYENVFGDVRIEDLAIPFFCVSCNLNSAQRVIHDDGLLWRAVRASTSIPGVFAPLISEGSLLIDGGIMDNLPAHTMKERGAGQSILVDVAPEFDLALGQRIGEMPTGWKLLANWINPFKQSLQVPNIFEILARTMVVNAVSRRLEEEHLAELVLKPPVQKFPVLDFSNVDALIEAGYRYTKPLVKKWHTNA